MIGPAVPTSKLDLVSLIMMSLGYVTVDDMVVGSITDITGIVLDTALVVVHVMMSLGGVTVGDMVAIAECSIADTVCTTDTVLDTALVVVLVTCVLGGSATI